MRSKLVSAAAVAALAAGCTQLDPVTQSPDPAFGDSVKYNALAQTIDPDPVYPEDSAQPGDNGDKGAQAVKRLRTDQVNARHKAEAPSSSNTLSTTEGTQNGGPR